MCAVRPIRRISVYSPTRAHREAFAAEMTTKLDIEVVPVAEPGHAVQGCEIVVEATNANEPVFEAEWLEPGTHVVTIRGSDRFNHQPVIDFEGTARRAGIMITDYREQIHLDDQRELLDLLEQGKIRWEDLHDIADLVAGRAPRRQSPDEITVHFHNTGMGVQFAALGALMERKARERGNLGRELPTEWFITVKGDAVWSP
jgi:ornithine cyclodeaminase/alanine dehydrogenase-like protein (mu-crystallin family)